MKVTRNGYLVIAGWVALYATITVLYFQTQIQTDNGLVRLFALFGITSLLNASIMSAFTRQIYQSLGVAFLKIHHLFAIAGLVLVTLHPVSLAILYGWQVFIPDFSSWYRFWLLAGRPAFYIVYVGVLSVLLKRLLKKHWRILHALLYVALGFGVVHGILLGQSHANPVIDGIYVGLLALMVFGFVYKRYTARARKRSTPQG
ncbi:MAG: hypothetical protein JW839_13160 [Candidatus Lokiarchaeota archaeon]|nr:hypothetical protein [Candidatus Lokiarchaeota archaeon]